ncbi:hypothetical protein [Paenibacillus eucommiae]|uniref:Uncharacterized protein n=1 Tax=Paenibacillus eucommiae TaxID=1355755 RepID=A0ABS4J4L9_9BACL|nr:hypothetical protein [Paenibacillus eucommiae]MBP1994776.1 hypothetical protein [Paenibacillus eucommiae]
MKLRLLPVAISVIVSFVILFGGWFAYHSLAMEQPLTGVINKLPGVEHSSIAMNSAQVKIELTLKEDADLREIVRNINLEGASIVGKRQLVIKPVGNTSPELEAWWSKALFDVAQAMENRQYSDIPKNLEELALSDQGMKVDTQMDDSYVYVRLTDGTNSKFLMLPRISAKIGVWPNE